MVGWGGGYLWREHFSKVLNAKISEPGLAWRHILLIPILRRQRQEGLEFQVSLVYLESSKTAWTLSQNKQISKLNK